jgi:hypothetical protein
MERRQFIKHMAKKKKDLKVTKGKESGSPPTFDELMDYVHKKQIDSYPERFESVKSRFNLKSQQEEFLSLLGPEKAKDIASTRIGNTVHEYVNLEGQRKAAYAVNMGVSFQYQNDQEKLEQKKKALQTLANAFVAATMKGLIAFGTLTECYMKDLDPIDSEGNLITDLEDAVGALTYRSSVVIAPACYELNVNYLNRQLPTVFGKIFHSEVEDADAIEPLIKREHISIKNFKNGTIELFVNLEFKIGGGKRFATKLATLSDCENVNMGMVASQFDREYFDNKRAKVIQNKLTWMNRVIDNACRVGYIEKDGQKIKFYGGKRGIIIKKQ